MPLGPKTQALVQEEVAVSAVEYAMMLSLIGAGLVAAMLSFGDAIMNQFGMAQGEVGGG